MQADIMAIDIIILACKARYDIFFISVLKRCIKGLENDKS